MNRQEVKKMLISEEGDEVMYQLPEKQKVLEQPKI
jgi:hypothetical protein